MESLSLDENSFIALMCELNLGPLPSILFVKWNMCYDSVKQSSS